VLVVPSPKFHDQDVMVPVEVFAKLTVSGIFPLLGVAVKLAVIGVHTVIVLVTGLEVPQEFVAIRVTV
jgi:hypothetical protein